MFAHTGTLAAHCVARLQPASAECGRDRCRPPVSGIFIQANYGALALANLPKAHLRQAHREGRLRFSLRNRDWHGKLGCWKVIENFSSESFDQRTGVGPAPYKVRGGRQDDAIAKVNAVSDLARGNLQELSDQRERHGQHDHHSPGGFSRSGADVP